MLDHEPLRSQELHDRAGDDYARKSDDAMLPAAQQHSHAASSGPEQGSAASRSTHWLPQMLDAVDYGMLLLVDGSHVVHVNRAARAELDDEHPLQLLGDTLRARAPRDVARLHDALNGALRGRYTFVALGNGDASIVIAVEPLGPLTLGGPKATLLKTSKRDICQRLSLQLFACCYALTPAETRVLERLSDGIDPKAVAKQHGVGLATVRTQIGAIRAKTGAKSILDLVQKLALLPPVVGALRSA